MKKKKDFYVLPLNYSFTTELKLRVGENFCLGNIIECDPCSKKTCGAQNGRKGGRVLDREIEYREVLVVVLTLLVITKMVSP